MGFLTNKTAIITGAGRAVLSDGRCGSIGYGIATAYAKEGANLVITGRNTQKLDAAKEELERLYGIRVLTVQADVTPVRTMPPLWKTWCSRQWTPSETSTCSSTTHRHLPPVSRWQTTPQSSLIWRSTPVCMPHSTT